MRLVHAADLHLDSPLRGLGRRDDAPVDEIRGATRRAFDNLVRMCIDEQAEILLIAGDLYDGDWKDYGTGLFFSRKMAELRQANVKVVWIRGNHDAASKLTKDLRLPDNVYELGCKRADTRTFEKLGVAVHGQGFATPAVLDDLSARYPEPIADLFNVGLLHTAVDGREGHAPYAPCRLTALVDKGYDYWALGHVHTGEILHRDPWIVFPGNLQGRHARETGAKGAVLIDVDDARVRSVETRALDVVRWAVCRVDASGAATSEDVLDRVREAFEREVARAEDRLLAARVVIAGASAAHRGLTDNLERLTHDVRSIAEDTGSVWVERLELTTRTLIDVGALRRQDGPIGDVARAFDALGADDTALRELAAELADLTQKLPPELRRREDGVALDDPAYLREALQRVAELVLPHLVTEDSSSPGAS